MSFEITNLYPPLSLLLAASIIKQEKKGERVLFVCNLFSLLFLAAPIEKTNVRLALRIDCIFLFKNWNSYPPLSLLLVVPIIK